MFEKNFASFPSIFARIRSSNIFAVTERTRNQNFLERNKNNFKFHFDPIRWVPKRFFKISIYFSQNLHFNFGFLSYFRKYSMRRLSIRGNDFIAHWAYEEAIYRTLSIRGTNFRACSASGKMWTVFQFKYTLSTRGTNFIAHRAYAERISSLTEHARNGFHR